MLVGLRSFSQNMLISASLLSTSSRTICSGFADSRRLHFEAISSTTVEHVACRRRRKKRRRASCSVALAHPSRLVSSACRMSGELAWLGARLPHQLRALFAPTRKSTFFNVLTKSAVPAENFPFCTKGTVAHCIQISNITPHLPRSKRKPSCRARHAVRLALRASAID